MGGRGRAPRPGTLLRRLRTAPPPAERSLLDAIAAGELDAHLAAIGAAVDARTRLLHTIDSTHRLATLCVGDRVRIGQRVSPRYLAGHDATIVELDDMRPPSVSTSQSGASRAAASAARRWCSRSPNSISTACLAPAGQELTHEIAAG